MAAKKYAGFTEDGKEVKLSNKRIKDMIPKAANFALKYPLHFLGMMKSSVIISEAISNDADLLETYNKLEKEEELKYYQDKEDRKRNVIEEEGKRQGQGEGQDQGLLSTSTSTRSTIIKY